MLFVLIAIVELHNKKEKLFCIPGNNVYTSQQSFYQNFVTVKSHGQRKLVVLFFVDEVEQFFALKSHVSPSLQTAICPFVSISFSSF